MKEYLKPRVINDTIYKNNWTERNVFKYVKTTPGGY